MDLVEEHYVRSLAIVWADETHGEIASLLQARSRAVGFSERSVPANIAMPEAVTNPDLKSWKGTDKIAKKENGKQRNKIMKRRRITNKEKGN